MVTEAWSLIIGDNAPEFLMNKGIFEHDSAVTFFYDTFYTRLFDVLPLSRALFKGGMKAQGKMLVQMISMSLSEVDNPELFDNSLRRLAEIHYQRGVKAVECNCVTVRVDFNYSCFFRLFFTQMAWLAKYYSGLCDEF